MGAPPARGGVPLAVAAYLIWGLLPLYLVRLAHVPSIDVVAHRVIWSLVFLVLLVGITRRLPAILRALGDGKVRATLLASAMLLSVNWLLYIWAVQNGQVLSTSLGYFISPLLNVVLAMLFLGERLRPVQAVAIAFAAAGVIVLAVSDGGGIWVPLLLALTFSLYGLLRKVVAIDALGGLATETALMAPAALLWLAFEPAGGIARAPDSATLALLVGSGIMTSMPLLLFAAAARRMRYVTIGVIQYLGPSIAFLSAVLLLGEPLSRPLLVTFLLIWSGIILYLLDGLRAERGTRDASPRSTAGA